MGHGSAAAEIHLAKLAGLPQHIRPVQNVCYIGHHFRGSVIGAVFAAGTGVFCHHHTTVQVRGISFLQHVRERGVERRVHIRRQAFCILEHQFIVCALCVRKITQEMEHKIAHKAGGAVGAHFFLVCQNAYRSVFRFLHPQLRLQRGIGAHTVIVAVRADHTAVKAHIRRLDGRNGLQLRAGKITFGDAVFLVQERQRIQLDALFQLFVRIRQRADHDIQLLAPQTVRQRAFILLCAQVRQQVRHAKHRVSRFLAQADFHLGAVLAVHYTVQGQRRGSPLVFANPTVIMRLEQRDVAVLVQRIRFEVKTRGINVRHHQTHALVQRALAQRS